MKAIAIALFAAGFLVAVATTAAAAHQLATGPFDPWDAVALAAMPPIAAFMVYALRRSLREVRRG